MLAVVVMDGGGGWDARTLFLSQHLHRFNQFQPFSLFLLQFVVQSAVICREGIIYLFRVALADRFRGGR